MSHNTRQTVLLIEQDPSLRRLITLGLQSRSIHVIETPSTLQLPALDGTIQSPDLLLLDINAGVNSDWSILATIQSHPHLSTLPIVLLTWDNLQPVPLATQTPLTCLTKPFDARTLYATIEQLLLETAPAPQEATTALATQERILLAQTPCPTPSIWPIITAAALLLTFIGLMINITIILLGLLVFLIAVLGWSLGKPPETTPAPGTPLSI
jgi:CheY-like chemotaxis protein